MRKPLLSSVMSFRPLPSSLAAESKQLSVYGTLRRSFCAVSRSSVSRSFLKGTTWECPSGCPPPPGPPAPQLMTLLLPPTSSYPSPSEAHLWGAWGEGGGHRARRTERQHKTLKRTHEWLRGRCVASLRGGGLTSCGLLLCCHY